MPEKAAHAAKLLGYQALGISDPKTLSGYAPFYHACKKEGIRPIFGYETETDLGPFAFYVLDEEGYRNLLSIYALEAEEEPLPSKEVMGHAKGLAAIYRGQDSRFRKDGFAYEEDFFLKLSRFMSAFPLGYIGIPYLPKETEYVERLREMAAHRGYEAIAFDLVAYQKSQDREALSILEAIDRETHLDPERPPESGDDYFLSQEEIASYFKKEEILALDELIGHIDFEYLRKRGKLLSYPLEGGLTPEEALRNLSFKGLKRKNPDYGEEYEKRLEYELSVIEKMGYSDYFLIVADYVGYAKNHGISVGPGRGSAGGSLVAYSLNITAIDPLRYDLLFERFLNPDRTSMPDIDVDFSDVRRDEVIAYLAHRYGKERVARVLTTSTIGPRQSLHDIGRVYGYSDRDGSLLSKNLDERQSLRENYRKNPSFKQIIDSDPYYQKFVALASKIEGLPRQAGLHAAGVIVDQNPLATSLPLKYEDGIGAVACLEKDYLEEQGFLKMDILGLRNLSMIDLCLRLYERRTGRKISQEQIPYDDEKAISAIADYGTAGLFQLESQGMTKTLKELRPRNLPELSALIALYRPGPMQQIPHFIARKNGKERVVYPSKALEGALRETYGIIVYQEQVMRIAIDYSSFSGGQADLFRRAISKKDAKSLSSLEAAFYEGARKNGHPEKEIKEVYDLIARFASYGFGKGHAYCYAALTGRMAFLKQKMPGEFYAAVMSAYSLKDPKFKAAQKEARSRGYRLHCPDINASVSSIIPRGNDLILPLSYINSLGGNLANALIEERETGGPYKDIFDLTLRGRRYGLKLVSLVRLIDAGALDCFRETRATLRGAAPAADSYSEVMLGPDGDGQMLDLAIEKPYLERREEDRETANREERAALGALISSSFLLPYKKDILESRARPLSDLPSRGNFVTCGLVTDVRAITTKKGSQMAFLEVEDDDGEASFTLFSENYMRYRHLLRPGTPILIEGTGQVYNGRQSYLINAIRELKHD